MGRESEQGLKKNFRPIIFWEMPPKNLKRSKKSLSEIGHDWYKKNAEFYAGFKNTNLP
jgi:hypothetical protein